VQTRKIKNYEIIEATCKELVAEGVGISYLDVDPELYKPLTAFIVGVLPGERFLARIQKVKSGYMHGSLLPRNEIPDEWIGKKTDEKYHFTDNPDGALLSTSQDRILSPCSNFSQCGGCKLLHLSYENTISYKHKWLLNHLKRNKVTDFPDMEISPSPDTRNYRNHAQIHINKKMERGLFAPNSYRTTPFPPEKCILFNQKLFDENFPEELKLVRCVRTRIDQFSGKCKIWELNSPADKKAEFTYNISYPPETITSVTIPNNSFFQVNNEMLPLWLNYIESMIYSLDLIDKNQKENKINILELFSGFGFISKMLSYKINLSSMGIDILKKREIEKVIFKNSNYETNVEKDFLENYIEHDLHKLTDIGPDKIMKIKNFKPDLLLINPPRSGFLQSEIEFMFSQILDPLHPAIIYSSCNGSTAARDLDSFQKKGYKINAFRLFDFFPWTSHYEIVAQLTFKNM